MTPVRSFTGETRTCPHCQGTILESATACPLCHRHLRFEAVRTDHPDPPTFCPLHIEGTIHQPDSGDSWEYSAVLEVRDDRGEVISRHVAAVGTLGPAQHRTFSFRVEVFTPDKSIL